MRFGLDEDNVDIAASQRDHWPALGALRPYGRKLMSDALRITIDGVEIDARPGDTIIKAAAASSRTGATALVAVNGRPRALRRALDER